MDKATIIYKEDTSEDYFIICKKQTCSPKLKNLEETAFEKPKKVEEVSKIKEMKIQIEEDSKNLIEKEREIQLDLIKSSGKPENIIQKILEYCDTVVNIHTEVLPSTVLLEALIMEKPVMNISLVDENHNFQFIKDNALIQVTDKSDLEKHFKTILYDEDLRKELIK